MIDIFIIVSARSPLPLFQSRFKMATAGTTLERASFAGLKFARINLKLLSTAGVAVGDIDDRHYRQGSRHRHG